MKKTLHKAIIGILSTAAVSSQAFAMGVEEVDLGVFTGTSISSLGHSASGKKGWADGFDGLFGSFGWVHTGTSFTKLQVGTATDIANGLAYDVTFKTTAEGTPGSSALDNPSFTIWTSGSNDFNLNARNFGWHTYDPVSGPAGTLNDPLATIGITDIVGYVNSGPSFTSYQGVAATSGWVNSTSAAVTDTSNSSWSSTQTTGLDQALLTVTGLKAGYYLIGVGGSCTNGACATGSRFQWDITGSITAAPVPIPFAAWLFGGAIASLTGFTKRKSQRMLRLKA